jgi:radical SAM superfamily enzyme with C-terminal helix-hairpin-helix motif
MSFTSLHEWLHRKMMKRLSFRRRQVRQVRSFKFGFQMFDCDAVLSKKKKQYKIIARFQTKKSLG